MKQLRYLSYVIRHKWYVFVEARKLGVPLLGAFHDLSKFRPDEWLPYADYFYGAPLPSIQEFHGDVRNMYLSAGCYQERREEDFDAAWLRHIHRNKHHWQYWVLREDDDGTKALFMPHRYRCEMLADWRGAGKAQDNPDTTKIWYAKNKDRIILHPETREWIEGQLEVSA